MELLRQVLILVIFAVSPVAGRYLHSLAPGEVAFARRPLKHLFAFLVAMSFFLVIGGAFVNWGVVLAVLVFFLVIYLNAYLVAGIVGVACALALEASDLTSVGLLIISGIILGSLNPKKEAVLFVSAISFVFGLIGILLLY